MKKGVCPSFLKQFCDEFPAASTVSSFDCLPENFNGLPANCPRSLDDLELCFKNDQSYWESKIKELSDAFHPLNERINAFTDRLMQKRNHYRIQLMSKLDALESILRLKRARQIPITERESNCVKRVSKLRKMDDQVIFQAISKYQRLMDAVHSDDSSMLDGICVFPELINEEPETPLQLEELLTDHRQFIQRIGNGSRPSDLSSNSVTLEDIIQAVDAEKKPTKKSAKKNKRSVHKSGAKVGACLKPHRKSVSVTSKKSVRKENFDFPSLFYHYVRGFFNILRLLLLELPGAEEEGLTTDQICSLVNSWQLSPRAQRTNSPWINRCPDWSLVTQDALALLSSSGRLTLSHIISSGNTEPLRVPKDGFIAKDERYGTWYWLNEMVSNADADVETALLARLFCLWAKAARGTGGLKDVWEASGHSSEDCAPKHTKKGTSRFTEALSDSADSSSDTMVALKSKPKSQRVAECVPPPYFPTEWECKLSNPEQRRAFQAQEAERFSQPWSPFVYNQHGYASVVGPVRTASAAGTGRGSGRAREHPLLRSDRPTWVSISEVVRDAVARLPNGEGTRPEIAMLVQDSAFLAPNFNPRQLSQCISSALDRLQGEGAQSPVMYDCTRRLWVYRYRHLSPEDFYRIYKDDMAVHEEKFNESCISQQGPSIGYSSRTKNRCVEKTDRSHVSAGAFAPEQSDYIPDIDELTEQDQFYDASVYPNELYWDESESENGDAVEGDTLPDLAAEGDAGRVFSEPRRMMLHYKPR